jgi:hypothetical protein
MLQSGFFWKDPHNIIDGLQHLNVRVSNHSFVPTIISFKNDWLNPRNIQIWLNLLDRHKCLEEQTTLLSSGLECLDWKVRDICIQHLVKNRTACDQFAVVVLKLLSAENHYIFTSCLQYLQIFTELDPTYWSSIDSHLAEITNISMDSRMLIEIASFILYNFSRLSCLLSEKFLREMAIHEDYEIRVKFILFLMKYAELGYCSDSSDFKGLLPILEKLVCDPSRSVRLTILKAFRQFGTLLFSIDLDTTSYESQCLEEDNLQDIYDLLRIDLDLDHYSPAPILVCYDC